MIWDNTAQILFYVTTGMAVTQLVSFIWYYRRRNPWMFLSIFAVLVCIVSNYLGWKANGICVLPYSRMVEYHSGVITLCPGQEVNIDLMKIWRQQQQQDI